MATPKTKHVRRRYLIMRYGGTLKLKDYRAILRPSVHMKAKAYPFSLIISLPILLVKKNKTKKTQQPKSPQAFLHQIHPLPHNASLPTGLDWGPLPSSVDLCSLLVWATGKFKVSFILISNVKNEWSILFKSAYCSKTVTLLPPLTFRRTQT